MTLNKKYIDFFSLIKESFNLIKSDPIIIIPCIFNSLIFVIFFNVFLKNNVANNDVSFTNSLPLLILVPVLLLIVLGLVITLITAVDYKKSPHKKNLSISFFTANIFSVLLKSLYYFIFIYFVFFGVFILLSAIFVALSLKALVNVSVIILLITLSVCNYFLPCFLFITNDTFFAGFKRFFRLLKDNLRVVFHWLSLYFLIFFIKLLFLTLFEQINYALSTTLSSLLSGVLESFLFIFTFLLVRQCLNKNEEKKDGVIIE